MASAKRPGAGQEPLFGVPGSVMGGVGFKNPRKDFERAVREWPGGIRPWDPIDAADTQLGWEYTYVTPRRAVEIRREIEQAHGDR